MKVGTNTNWQKAKATAINFQGMYSKEIWGQTLLLKFQELLEWTVRSGVGLPCSLTWTTTA